MACTYTVVVYGTDSKQLPLITTAALDEVDRIDALMSNYKPESPLSQLNREAGEHAVLVEPELFRFLERCFRYSQQSEGGFDITVGPLMKAWGFFRGEGRIPWSFELWSVLRKVGYQHLRLDATRRTIQFERRAWIGLGRNCQGLRGRPGRGTAQGAAHRARFRQRRREHTVWAWALRRILRVGK
jgi:thiamine biosynthesis lipoprotein